MRFVTTWKDSASKPQTREWVLEEIETVTPEQLSDPSSQMQNLKLLLTPFEPARNKQADVTRITKMIQHVSPHINDDDMPQAARQEHRQKADWATDIAAQNPASFKETSR